MILISTKYLGLFKSCQDTTRCNINIVALETRLPGYHLFVKSKVMSGITMDDGKAQTSMLTNEPAVKRVLCINKEQAATGTIT